MTKKLGDRDLYIPFSAAVRAAWIPETRVRNWLLRKQLLLDADRERQDESKHRRFSRLDVLRLALVSHLTGFGISTARASILIETQIFYGAISKMKRGLGQEIELPDLSHGPDDYDKHCILTVAQTPECEVIDSLRNLTATLFYMGHKDLSPEDDFSMFQLILHDRSQEPHRPQVGVYESLILIRIGLIIERLEERMEAAGLM